VPADRCARAICAAVGRPITATSANVSGQSPTADPSEVERTLGDRIAFLFDAGTTRGGAASTIVDVSGVEPALVRAGAISWEEIQACLDNDHRGPKG
jgi:L-threonylcarbamoyladenylate synthase